MDLFEKFRLFLFKYKIEIILSSLISVLLLLCCIFLDFFNGIDKKILENEYYMVFFSVLTFGFLIFLISIFKLWKYVIALFIFKNSKYKILKILFLVFLAFPLYFGFIFFRDFFEVSMFYLLNISLILFFIIFFTIIFFGIFMFLERIFPEFRKKFENFGNKNKTGKK